MTKSQSEEFTVNGLDKLRSIIRETRGFFGNKKLELKITHTDIRPLNAKKQKLEQKMHDVQQWYNSGAIFLAKYLSVQCSRLGLECTLC